MRTRKKKDSGRINVVEAGSVPPPAPAPKTGFASIPKGWKPAAQALDYVRAIPTCLLDLNRATRIGGIPSRRIITMHGPTHGGKTAALAATIRSYVDAGHVGAYVDAEHATDLAFFDGLFGRRCETIPNFFGKRPESYEEIIDDTDSLLAWMVAERRGRFGKGGKVEVPPKENLACILWIDSINKLVPKREIEKLKGMGAEAIDKGWGRLRAQFNQAFLDHVIPKLGPAETTLGLIAQERDDEDVPDWEMPTVKGGKALRYDASLVIRVLKGKAVKRGSSEEDKVVYGFQHKLRIWKSKIGGMDGRYSDAFFHMSNGELVPEGFDFARDAVEVAKALGIIQVSGSWLSWNRSRWQGAHQAVVKLSQDPEKLAALQAACNAKIREEAA